MKKLIATLMTLLLAGACHSGRPSTTPAAAANGNMTGAPDPAGAVRAYLKAVEQQDLQAMGAVWGGPDGPARDLLPRRELEEREIIIMCTLKHDRFDIIGDAPNPDGGRAIAVNMFVGNQNRSHTFDVVQGPAGRWYVKTVDLKTLTGCGK